MGLLNWRRQRTGADSSRLAEPAAAVDGRGQEDPGAPAQDVIRADSFTRVPEWAQLPPMQLSLPEMPSIMSKRFDQSLVSWQPPALFVGDLGHTVSPVAPSGIVEGMAVLVPTPQPEPAEPMPNVPPVAESLPLAVPPSPVRDGTGRAAQVTVRRLPSPFDEPEPGWDEGSAGDEAHAYAAIADPPPFQAAEAMQLPPEAVQAGWAPSHDADRAADMVGAAPLVSPAQPLVSPLLADPAPSRLTHAATPPEMPLVRLPAALLPDRPRDGESASRPAGHPAEFPPSQAQPAEPVVSPGPVAGPVAGLVGDRPISDAPAPPLGAGPAGTDVPAGRGPAMVGPGGGDVIPGTPAAPGVADLTLAVPTGGPTSQTRRLEQPVEQWAEQSHHVSSSDVGGTGDVPAPGESGAGSGGSDPAVPGGSTPIAPLVGQTPVTGAGSTVIDPSNPPSSASSPGAPTGAPLSGAGPSGADAQPLVVARPAGPSRGGLGEPMTKLPGTATGWDVTRMSRAEQLQASRALIQRHMAAASQQLPGFLPPAGPPNSPGRATGLGTGIPAVPQPGPVLAGMNLPLAPIHPVGPRREGVIPDDLPPAGAEQAPLLGSAPSLFDAPEAEASSSTAPPEGQRARTAVGQRYGVDLSLVPIDRSPHGASEASQLRARAFTSDRGVVIPPAVGTLDSGPGQALLAHELTHVAQRARLGPSVPSEDSLQGQALEGEARLSELTLSSPPAARPALPAPGRSADPSSLTGMFADRQEAAPPLPLASPAPAGPDPDSLAASIMERLSGLTSTAPFPGAQTGGDGRSMAAAPAPATTAGPVQRATLEETAQTGTPDSSSTQSTTSDSGLAGALKRPTEEDLSNLSRWLYPLIKYRLKGELREDRERAGLLTDHYRRW